MNLVKWRPLHFVLKPDEPVYTVPAPTRIAGVHYSMALDGQIAAISMEDWLLHSMAAGGRVSDRVAVHCYRGLTCSTVFLSIDHGFGFNANAVLFETMVFGARSDYQRRYTSRAAARVGHANLVRLMVCGTTKRRKKARWSELTKTSIYTRRDLIIRLYHRKHRHLRRGDTALNATLEGLL